MILRNRWAEPIGALLLLVAAVALVFAQGHAAHVPTPIAPWNVGREIAHTGVAAVVLFGLCGLGPTRMLLPEEWRPHQWLFVLPVGAACSTLALTVLGLGHVPFGVSLPIVLAAGALLAILSLRTRQPRRPSDPVSLIVRLIVPVGLCLAVGAIVLMPSLRAGLATVEGQNGDAILAVGTGTLLRHAPPTAVRPDLPLDRVPLEWRSKLPIYYGLAGVATIAGQDAIMAFSPLCGLVLAMFCLGILLLAIYGLRAPPLLALTATFLVALDRIVVYTSMHTYYNQLWALFTLPFVLLTGWRFLRAPSGRSAALFGLFLALALFTYPLLLPFPVVFLAVIAWRERARGREWARSLRLPRWAVVVAVVVAVPVIAVLVRGIVEKLIPAMDALRPGGDLSGWAGGKVLPYLPFGRFLGVETSHSLALQVVLCVAIIAAAIIGLDRGRSEVGLALIVLLAGALLSGLYLRLRGQGELFWLKDLGFAGPLILVAAIVGLGSLGRSAAARAVGAVALVLLAFGLYDGTRREIAATYELASLNVLEIRDWDRQIPAADSIRIDIGPGAWQMWGWYLLSRHRVCATDPQRGFFPYPPYGLHADLALVQADQVPKDALGPPLFTNKDYSIYRLLGPHNPNRCSQKLIFDVDRITF